MKKILLLMTIVLPFVLTSCNGAPQEGGDSSYGGSGLLSIIILSILLIIYYLICKKIGQFADRKGRKYWTFFLISFFFSPLIGFIIVALLDETEEKRFDRIKKETEYRMQIENQIRQQQNKSQLDS